MKRFIIVVLVTAILFFGGLATANVSNPSDSVPAQSSAGENKLPVSVIDGIEVPYEVVTYAQEAYQGYAITHADQVSRGGRELYRLKIGRDLYDTNDARYLFYSMEWKLIDEQEIVEPVPEYVPPAPRSVRRQPAPTQEAAPPSQPSTETAPLESETVVPSDRQPSDLSGEDEDDERYPQDVRSSPAYDGNRSRPREYQDNYDDDEYDYRPRPDDVDEYEGEFDNDDYY